MRTIILLVFTAMVCASCGAFGQGFDPDILATAVKEAVAPALSQVEGLTPEQVDAITSAIGEGIKGNLKLPEGGFDWEGPLWAIVSVVSAYFGINIRRDLKRAKRGEKV